MRAAAKKHGDTKGIHASSEQQQHKHGTAQASEQGAEGGGGVLTRAPIDATDAGMAMAPARPVLENACCSMVSRLLLAANSTLVNFEHRTKACGDVQYRQGRCEQQQRQWDSSSSQQQQQEQQQRPVTK